MSQPATKNIFTPSGMSPRHRPTEDHRSPKIVSRAALVLSVLMIAAALLYFITPYLDDVQGDMRLATNVAAAVFLFTAGLMMSIALGFLKNRYFLQISFLNFCILLALLTAALFTDQAAIFGSLVLLSGILIGNYFFTGERTELFILVSIFGGLGIIWAGIYSPFLQSSNFTFSIFWFILLASVLVLLVYLFASGRMPLLLRMKLFSGAIIIALIPLISFAIIFSSIQQRSLDRRNESYVRLAAMQNADKVNTFIDSNLSNLTQQSRLAVFENYLKLPKFERAGTVEERELANTIAILSRSSEQKYLKSYGVLDAQGTVVFDSYPPMMGTSEANEQYFRYSFLLGQGYFSSIRFLLYPYDAPEVLFSAPILDKTGKSIGVVRMRYNADVFQSILQEYRMGSGEQSYPILIDENKIRLVDSLNPEAIYSPIHPLPPAVLNTLRLNSSIPNAFRPENAVYNPALDQAINNIQAQPYFYGNVNPTENDLDEVGYVVRITKVPWYLVFVQDQTLAAQQRREQINAIVRVVSVFVALAGLLALAVARLMSNPIQHLTESAVQITQGDLEVQTFVKTDDEIGTLAQAFNLMTQRLRTTINELEDRVAARTSELANQNLSLTLRSQQLKTISEVARTIVAEQDLEILLSQVTRLISERFNFYHVGIFLIDPAGQYAVLRAANSEGGQRMLARQHKLRVGQVGIVGFATGTGQARIATDVGEDSIYFNNPDLPRTRSEMALPLKAGDQVIGALDVQSTVPNAFLHEDIELFSTLADQVAVAIMNSRLFEETQDTLKEMQEVHRQYLRQSWAEQAQDREQISYRYSHQGTTTHLPLTQEQIAPILQLGKVISSSDEEQTLGLPLLLRGEPIGVIQIQSAGSPGSWDPSQIAAIEKVADQIAQALENARLFEETSKRADRDRKVLEITSKIRSTTDFNAMLQIAIDELTSELHASGAQVILQQTAAERSAQQNSLSDNGHEH